MNRFYHKIYVLYSFCIDNLHQFFFLAFYNIKIEALRVKKKTIFFYRRRHYDDIKVEQKKKERKESWGNGTFDDNNNNNNVQCE